LSILEDSNWFYQPRQILEKKGTELGAVITTSFSERATDNPNRIWSKRLSPFRCQQNHLLSKISITTSSKKYLISKFIYQTQLVAHPRPLQNSVGQLPPVN
jgi:hypothetical protein